MSHTIMRKHICGMVNGRRLSGSHYFFLGAVAAFFAGAFFTAGLAAFLATVLAAGAFTAAFFAGAFLAAGLAAFAGFFAAAIHLTSLPGTLLFSGCVREKFF